MGKRQEIERAIQQLEAQRDALGDSTVDTAIDGLRRQVAEIDNKTHLEKASQKQGERRVVTMLFSDVRGSTAAASQLDPEDWSRVMNGVFERMIAPVNKYGGTIVRLMGDAILAFFGAPSAHENDPQRAILAGLDIVSGMQPYRQEVKDQWGIDIDVRVGINTGMVLVGNVGADGHLEYTAMGDAINIAARMEQTAAPGTVQITSDTHQLAEQLFDFKDLGGIQVKGQTEPVESFQVLAIKKEPGRQRGLQGHGLHSPLVGREQALTTAETTIQNLLSGKGGILAVIGEAGLGKSRLISELKDLTKKSKWRLLWLEGQALSFGQTISYWPFQEMLRGYAGILEEDTEQQAWDKMETGVVDLLGEDAIDILPYLASLLSLEVRGEYLERVKYLQAEAMGQQVFLASRRFFERLASRQPLVLFFEDLHWLDESSAKLIEHLLPLSQSQSLLMVVTTRPEPDTPAAALRETASETYAEVYTELRLEPLTSEDSERLVHNLLDIDDLPPALRRTITDKADGNPFFVEEIIRHLIDSKVIIRAEGTSRWRAIAGIQDVTIPDSLQGVIMTRIDRLDNEARQVLGAAAVIGRTFFYRVLKLVETADEALDGSLEVLKQVELIMELSKTAELEYIFKHALAQEAVYENLLRERRRVLHTRVGEAIEQLFADRLEEFYGLLAYHYTRAEVWEKAQEYLFKAGDQASGIAADKEALVIYRRALVAYERAFGDHWDSVQQADIEGKIGQILVRLGEYSGSIPHFDQALHLLGRPTLATKWAVRSTLIRAGLRQMGHRLLPWFFLHASRRPLTKAEEVELSITHDLTWALLFVDLERFTAVRLAVLNRAERLEDLRGIAEGAYSVGIQMDALGFLKIAGYYHQMALKTAETLKNPIVSGELRLAFAQHQLQSGDLNSARQHVEASRAESHKSGDILTLGWSTLFFGHIAFLEGDFNTSVAYGRELIKLGEDVGALQLESFGRHTLGLAQMYQGKLEDAIANMSVAVEIFEQVPDYLQLALAGARLAETYLLAGQYVRAHQVLASTEETTRPHVFFVFQLGYLVARKALIALTAVEQPGSFKEVANHTRGIWLKKAGSACRECLKLSKGVRIYLPTAMRLQGTYQWLRGKPATAHRWWEKSLDLAIEMGLRPDAALTRYEIGKRFQEKELLETAAAMFEKMGMAHFLDLAQESINGLD